MSDRIICLTDHEAKGLAEGRVTAFVRPMRYDVHPANTGEAYDAWVDKQGIVRYNAPKDGGYQICRLTCPFGVPGDTLLCKEKWAQPCFDWRGKEYSPINTHDVVYAADDGKEWYTFACIYHQYNRDFRWHPSMHIPPWAVRHRLKVKAIECIPAKSLDTPWGEATDHHIALGFSTYLREHDACCDLQEQFVTYWNERWGKKYPLATSWVWFIEIDKS